jgi:ElaB/YqjD/DUF883 family membrane-anchored ribosome-binding protein
MADEPKQDDLTKDEAAIKHQMEQTRTSLSDKLETLESTLVSTVKDVTDSASEVVENVKETVSTTVENVGETVSESVAAVQETFNFRRHVEEHPWVMVGAAAAVGFALGALIPSRRRRDPRDAVSRLEHLSSSVAPFPRAREGGAGNGHGRRRESRAAASEAKESGGFLGLFRSEFDKLKGLALGATFSVLRDVATQSAPAGRLRQGIADLFNSAMAKLGGKPLEEGALSGEPGPGRREQPAGEAGTPGMSGITDHHRAERENLGRYQS